MRAKKLHVPLIAFTDPRVFSLKFRLSWANIKSHYCNFITKKINKVHFLFIYFFKLYFNNFVIKENKNKHYNKT